MSAGKITITFDPRDLDEEAFIKNALVQISNLEDGSPSLSSGQLLNLLTRVLGVLTLLSSKKVTDAYYAASQISGFTAEAIRGTLKKEFQITVCLETPVDQQN